MSGTGPEVLFGSNQRPERVSISAFHLLQERTHLRLQARYALFLVETNLSTDIKAFAASKAFYGFIHSGFWLLTGPVSGIGAL